MPIMRLNRIERQEMTLAAVVLAVLLTLVPTTGYLYVKNGRKKFGRSSDASIDLSDKNAFTNGILVLTSVTDVNPDRYSFTKHFAFKPVGKYAQNYDPENPLWDISSPKNLFLKTPVNFTIEGRMYPFAANAPMTGIDASYLFTSGETSRYPFDVFIGSAEMYAIDENGPVPVALVSASGLQQYNIRPRIETYGSRVFVEYSVARAATTKIFSVFLILTMWVLSLTVFSMACSIWIRKRKIEPPTVAVSGAFLFALPAIRNTQPTAPPIGTLPDMCGFFWNMMLIAISVVLMVVNYIHSYQPDPSLLVDPTKLSVQQLLALEEKIISRKASVNVQDTNFLHVQNSAPYRDIEIKAPLI